VLSDSFYSIHPRRTKAAAFSLSIFQVRRKNRNKNRYFRKAFFPPSLSDVPFSLIQRPQWICIHHKREFSEMISSVVKKAPEEDSVQGCNMLWVCLQTVFLD
jgi:hypothetical protein